MLNKRLIYIAFIALTLLLISACKDDAASSSDADCTELGETLIELGDDLFIYAEAFHSGTSGDQASCDEMCADAVEAAQELVENSCDWPDFEDEDFPTGPVTQEDVDGMEEGFCGEVYGVCGSGDDGGDDGGGDDG